MRSLFFLGSIVTSALLPFTAQAADNPHTGHQMPMAHYDHATAATNNMHVMQGWSRALPPTAQAGAAFLMLHNMGTEADRLMALESPIAKVTELHTHIHENGVMKMTKLDDLAIKAGEMVMFEPGGYHVMLIGLNKALVEGETFPVTLIFEKAGKIELEVAIKSPDSKADSAGNMDHSQMHH